jgi:hypothetical protein
MNQNPFEGEALDEAEDAGEAWTDEGFDDDDAFAEGHAEGFEDEGLDAEALEAEGFEDDEAFEEEGFDEDGFEAEALDDDAYDEGDALEAGDALDEEGAQAFEGEGVADEADGMGDDAGDELEEAFAEAMDAQDEDEFARRLTGRLRARLRRAAGPFLRRMAARAVPIGLQLIRQVSRMQLSGASRVDAMDAFADAAADEAMSRAQMNLYIPFLAGLAGRYVTRAIISASRRRAKPAMARAIGRAVTSATRGAARAIVRRHGARAIRSVPRLVRQVVRVARQQRGAVRSVPSMIRRAGGRVAASRPAAARLSRPSATVRRAVARAGVRPRHRPGASVTSPSGAPRSVRHGSGWGGARGRTIHVHGPVRIITQQPPVAARRPL